MTTAVIVGAQWGDEGKGKIVDVLMDSADVVVRYGGGPNAGHTLVVGDQKIIVRLIPSGFLRPHAFCVLAQGMVIDPAILLQEIDELSQRGCLTLSRLMVSERAHLLLPYHILVDQLREQSKHSLGTTKRGVGPCYEDKVGRRGIRCGALRDLKKLSVLVTQSLAHWSPLIVALGGQPPSHEENMESLAQWMPRLVPLLADTTKFVTNALKENKHVLFEGAQGTLLDLEHGTYPYVTSSYALAAGACVGSGIAPSRLEHVIGLAKAYCTRVGEGPFPTEIKGALGERLRQMGAEFGSVTGRPRRVGWLDLPALRYVADRNGFNGLVLTKLDVLTGLDEIKVCVRYQTSSGETEDFPLDELESATPIYRTFPGWKEDLSSIRNRNELPLATQNYLNWIEKSVNCPLILISVGSRRDEILLIRHPFLDCSKNVSHRGVRERK
ncbi:adenylosuccinate synthase [Pajaroellobacter abortibovis]|uniref:Adenylosuccinate synthetase n=1 Tax=Pajaroellobacter abortibovis TaxID=1882918 RepID=A0A1L6MXG0_9BACT|nr:adenylosuccinate synthase [Pajaroellobacter abortibovis]APS00146.1 adenylosuccinate synthase [Pajaroellobacter abortibovis]